MNVDWVSPPTFVQSISLLTFPLYRHVLGRLFITNTSP